MYIFNNSIPICTSYDEDEIFLECYSIIDTIIITMKENDCDKCMSMETGEVITLKDFERMKGILNGLPKISIMYPKK